MDCQRRAQALIARSRSVLCALSFALLALSLSGCRNKQEQARQKAELTQALDQFKAQIDALQKQTAVLRARFDKLPEDLPGIGPVRDDLHALEEGLGVEGGRAQWLAGELDKAFGSGSGKGQQEEIEAVRKAVPRGTEGMAQMLVKVTHEVMPLERVAGQRHFFEELDAKNAKAEAAQKKHPKADPPKADPTKAR